MLRTWVLSGGFLAGMCVTFTASQSAQAAALPYTVRVDAWGTSAIEGSNDERHDSGDVMQPSVTETAHAERNYNGISAAGDATGTATPGSLHFKVNSYASCPGGGGAVSNGIVYTSYTDQLTITSDTLPAGTPVQLSYDSIAHSIFSAAYDNGPASMASSATLHFDMSLRAFELEGGYLRDFQSHSYNADSNSSGNTFDNAPHEQTGLLNAVVGGLVTIESHFNGSVHSNTADSVPGVASAEINALNTAELGLAPVGSAFSFSSASGSSYSVPEPTSVATILLPVAGAALRRRRPATHG